MAAMRIAKCAAFCLLVACLLTNVSGLKKKKRGVYHALPGYALPTTPLGFGFHKGFHASPYAKFPGFYRSHGGLLPPGYGLFPGGASVTSYQKNFPRFPAVYGTNLVPTFGVADVKPFADFAPFAPLSPVGAGLPVAPSPLPAVPAFSVAPQIPTFQLPASNTQQTSFFATYPQKPIIPIAVPAVEKPKIPVYVQKPLFTAFSNAVPSNVVPTGVYNPSVAVSNVHPQFVGIPVVTGTASAVTPSITTLSTGVTQSPQQPWRPVVVSHPSPTPTPSTGYLPPYTSSPEQIFISSTPAPSLHHHHHHHQAQQQALLELEQGNLHHQDGHGAFNGQPYDIASNHGRYTGPSSYDVDITHNGYQKKK